METRLLQLYPNRITLTNKRQPLAFHKVEFNKQCRSYIPQAKPVQVKNFQVIKNPFKVSKTSKKKILDSINSMYMLSQPRKIEMKTKKFIYNYRLSFITLTLPSAQVHTDTEIKQICLNQFLVEIRKHYQVKNYVWKAELQKNNNIHFHLILDRYVDFQALRRRWNRIINKLDYVEQYSNKFRALNLSQYHALRNKTQKCSFEKSKAAFAAGKKCNWTNPNSVDVRSVFSKKELAIYLGKYIAKSSPTAETTAPELARELAFGRSWYRSSTLAKLKYQNKFLAAEMTNLISYLRSKKEIVLEIQNDFFTVFYFSAEQLSKAFQTFHKKIIFENAKMYKYPIPIPA